MTLFYIYDAYCGWCYGFSPVMKKIADKYNSRLAIDVLSGGMIIDEQVHPISRTADYIRGAYPRVEELTGVQFGEYYLWHINHPDESDWIMNSEKAAIALCIFKEYDPDRALEFAWELQYALNYEGRDLCDDEAYRHILAQHNISAEDFYAKLHSEAYKDKARYEFALAKHLQVTGYPCLLLQSSDSKFYLLARGYTDFETLDARISNVLDTLATAE
jgi:putative protein-disulfide isomerase